MALGFFRKRRGKEAERLRETLIFLLKLLALALPLYLVVWFSVDLHFLREAAASELEWALLGMGYSVEREGAMLTVSGGGPAYPFTFYIVEDCTAWKSMLFLFALIAAVPSIRWRRRLVGIVIGLPVLWFGNLLRNVSVVLLERTCGLETAMLVHDWLWRAGLMALVLAVWLAWWGWARGEKIWLRFFGG
jgi:exosortase/archaeosortase family protein